jgi:hypothetical protein
MSQQVVPCPRCRSRQGQVIPSNFVAWWSSNGIRFPKSIGISQEEATNRDISGFLTYLKSGNFSRLYHDRFRDWIDKLQSSQRASFDFTLSDRELGFLSFKQWAENATTWYKEHHPTSSDHEIHLRMLDDFAHGILSLRPLELNNFRKKRETNADECIKWSLLFNHRRRAWKDFGLCDLH